MRCSSVAVLFVSVRRQKQQGLVSLPPNSLAFLAAFCVEFRPLLRDTLCSLGYSRRLGTEAGEVGETST